MCRVGSSTSPAACATRVNGSMEKVASGVYLLKPIGRQGHGGYDN